MACNRSSGILYETSTYGPLFQERNCTGHLAELFSIATTPLMLAKRRIVDEGRSGRLSWLMSQIGGLSLSDGRCDASALGTRWQGMRWVIVVAIILRLVVALWSEHIRHPDEVFQYLEQAHRLVFGYGIVPWEYRFGIRNWLLPGMLAGWLHCLSWLGLGQPAFYVPATKCALALLSLSLVYACYDIGRNLFSERVGRLSAVFAAIWYECLFVSTIPAPEVISTLAIVHAVALATRPRSLNNVLALGLLIGLGVSLRVHYVVPVLFLSIVVWQRWGWRAAFGSGAMAFLVLALAGWLDYWAWGVPFYSFYGSVQLNLLYGISSVFGQQPPLWYVKMLFSQSAGMYLVALAYAVVRWRRCGLLLVMVLAVLVPHSAIAHKEYRFVILEMPFLLVLLADAAVEGVRLIRTQRAQQWSGAVALILFCGISAVYCVKRGVLHRDDRLMATLQLGKQPHVDAVLDLTGPWYQSGGYYYLHHDVPYYFPEQVKGMAPSEFHEFASHILLRVPYWFNPKAVKHMGPPKFRAFANNVLLRAHVNIPPSFVVESAYGSVLLLTNAKPPARFRQLPALSNRTWLGLPKPIPYLKPTVKPRF